MKNLSNKNKISNTTKSNNYPLIGNKLWYAENGTVYNKADSDFRVLLIAGKRSEINLPNDVAEKIADYLNNR